MGRCRQRRRRGRVGRTVPPARRSPEKWCSSPGPRAASAARWRSPAPRPGPTWPSRTGPTAAAPTIRPRVSAGTAAEPLSVDVADELALETMVAQVREAFGRVDVWVNNAGADILTGEAARLTWPEKLDRLLAVDLRGTVLASWKAVALMRGQPSGGVILNVSWDHVLAGGTKGGYAEVFCAAKGGVYSFSRALARSVAPHIRV